ncbi:MAG: leucine-rich repeat domain-containing protein [Clostridia bacterium]|nr:leucine-rich repeat domain-containing protein [Clostridia bacterium]
MKRDLFFVFCVLAIACFLLTACNTKPDPCTTHTVENWATTTEATCTENGTEAGVCIVCNERQERPITAHGHSFAIWTVTQESTCAVKGSKKSTCTICGEITVQAIPMTDHPYVDTTVKPTITEDGYIEHVCPVCQDSYREYCFQKLQESNGLSYMVNQDGITCTVTGFGSCKDTDLVIPLDIDGHPVTKIRHSAFRNCTTIKTVFIHKNVEEIGAFAFSDCTNLKRVTLENGVKCIREQAFRACTGLTEFTLPASLTYIDNAIFLDCENLKTVYYNSDFAAVPYFTQTFVMHVETIVFGGTTVPDNICTSSSDLKTVIIKDSVKCIGKYAFANTDIETIILPDGLESIGDYAFFYAQNLKSITIPASVTQIGVGAFKDCAALQEIVFEDPDGWWQYTPEDAEIPGSAAINASFLSVPEKAAELLVANHTYYWKKEIKNEATA